MLKKSISRVFIIIASIACLQVLGTIILARTLIKPEMGLYRLIITLVELGALVSLLGIDHAFVRFFSSPATAFQQYDWKGFLKKSAPVGIGLAIIFTAGVSIIYRFNLFITLAIIIILIGLALLFLFAAILRAEKKYALSVFLARNNSLVFFLLLTILYFANKLSFTNVVLFYMLSVLCGNFIIIPYCLKYLTNGTKPIPNSVLKNGLYYFGISISIMLMIYTGPLLIGKMLSYKDLAIYAVIASIMRLFEFTQDSAYYVLAPHLNSKRDIRVKKIFLGLLGVSIIIAFFYILFGKIIVHFFFKGLYDQGYCLLPFFVGIGIVRTLHVLPNSIIGGRSMEETLRNQFYITLAAAIINMGLTYVFIRQWSLRGAASANLIAWSILFVATLLATRRYMPNTGGYQENAYTYTSV